MIKPKIREICGDIMVVYDDAKVKTREEQVSGLVAYLNQELASGWDLKCWVGAGLLVFRRRGHELHRDDIWYDMGEHAK